MELLTLRTLADALVPQVVADSLLSLCRRTGQAWGPNARDELFWYRSPKVHVLEFIILHIFVYLCFRASWGYTGEARKHVQRVSHGRSTKGVLNKLLGTLCLLCWMSQVFFKAARPHPFVQLGWLLMPCHLLSLLWAAVLLRSEPKHYPWNVYLATLAASFQWGPLAAVAFPDFGDHQYVVEKYIFIVHHHHLLFLPLYFATRYELLPFTASYLLHATGVATLINVGFYTVYSYVSGLNLNYMLYPPPNLLHVFPFTSMAYRFYVIPILILLTGLFHVVIRRFGRSLRWMQRRGGRKRAQPSKEINVRHKTV